MKWLVLALLLTGCVSPRSNSIFALDFSDQAMTALMRVTCNQKSFVVQGVFACESRAGTTPEPMLEVKILPVPGRVVYSDGQSKMVDDFNWREKGFWIFKKKAIDETWATLALGELRSIYGEVPIAFSVSGLKEDTGVIVNRGIFLYTYCDDLVIKCSRAIVKYECVGSFRNTYLGEIGYCSRMSGSSQAYELPTKTPHYELSVNDRILIRSGRTGWSHRHDITQVDIDSGSVKFSQPAIINGPDLISFRILHRSQGVVDLLDTKILIVGHDARWTGIDRPHYFEKKNKIDWYSPVLSDFIEVHDIQSKTREYASKGPISIQKPMGTQCGYAWERETGAMSYLCINDKTKEVGHP